MGEGMLDHGTVVQYRRREVAQILLTEKRQRQLPQRFSEGDPAHAAFLVGREEGRVILPELRDVNQKKRNNDADDIKEDPVTGYAVIHHILCQRVQEAHREHQH